MSRSFEDLQREHCEEHDIDLAKNTLAGSMNQMALALLPAVAAKTGRGLEEVRKSFIGLRLDPRPLIDGRATTPDNWRTYEISLSEGLLIFHHKMVKLFVTPVSIVGDGQRMVEETRFTHEETLSIARQLMASFWEGTFFQTPAFSMVSLTKRQITLQSLLLNWSESFVIGHEFGHVIMHESPDCTKRDLLILKGVEDGMVRPVLGKRPALDEAATLRNWMEELAADFVGVNLCASLTQDTMQRALIHASGLLSLILCDMLEQYRRKVGGAEALDPTHPPAALRREVMRTLLDWPAGMDLGDAFGKFSQWILERI